MFYGMNAVVKLAELNLTSAVVLPSELSLTKSDRDKCDEDLCQRKNKNIDHGIDLLLCKNKIWYPFFPQSCSFCDYRIVKSVSAQSMVDIPTI